jgi:hypothetical protein
MTDKQSEFVTEQDPHASYSKSHEHYNPVVLTDTVGALFLGSIAVILMAIVGGLLIYIRRLEERLRALDGVE